MARSSIRLCVICALCFFLADANVPVIKSKNGVLEYNLTVKPDIWKLPFKNISFQTRLYNGMSPGPTFEVEPGDTVKIYLINGLGPNPEWSNCKSPDHQYKAANATNLHIHGIYDDSFHDNTFLCMESGVEVMYSFLVDPRSTTSTLFYHPHMDGSSAMQLYGGMAGAFIIKNNDKDADHGLADMKTAVCVLQMLDFNPKSVQYLGTFMANQNPNDANPTSQLPLLLENPENYTGVLLLTNGEVAPEMNLDIGEGAILRFINAMSGADNIAHLAFAGSSALACTLDILAYDGVYLKSARRQASVFIPAGGRADIAVACSSEGKHCLTTTELSGAPYGMFGGLVEPGHDAFCLDIKGISTKTYILPAELPGPPLYYNSLMKEHVHITQKGNMTLSTPDGANSIDGKLFDGSVTTVMKHGSVQEWNLFGGEEPALENYHPFHQHNTHFQIMAVSFATTPPDVLVKVGDWRDTVPLYKPVNYTVRFVAPFTNLVMVHCHILKHEDLGMMTLWNVTNAPVTEIVKGGSATLRHGLPDTVNDKVEAATVAIWVPIVCSIVFCLVGLSLGLLPHLLKFRRRTDKDNNSDSGSGEFGAEDEGRLTAEA
eukprot:TRINITY_DN29043_c0_g2_i1.p1 TRINITY_DN29043_c0_g2~~TRINITY_DN29043_c0_g2_i1.p1  ORF type:complete len:620 (+),score=102.05 TRINITY_DN29043_c0_g2_i1:59-1861(+)